MLHLLEKHYAANSVTLPILLEHSRRVAARAVAIAENLSTRFAIDVRFVEDAALLHDIGIGRTWAPSIGCRGNLPYLAHGIIGREILETEGLPRHALVCERHIGVGLGRRDIIEQSLPLPCRDMRPLTLEEKIVAYADLFYSKTAPREKPERTFADVRSGMMRHGQDKVARLDEWHRFFSDQTESASSFDGIMRDAREET